MSKRILEGASENALATVEMAREASWIYDPDKNMTWKTLVYRKSAPFTDSFGYIPGRTAGSKIHTGTDRGIGDGYVRAPFMCQAHMFPYGGGPGTILRMYPCVNEKKRSWWLGFFIDVYHCPPKLLGINPNTKQKDEAYYGAGEVVAAVGTEGKSTGLHTHTELCVPVEARIFSIAHTFLFARQGNMWGQAFGSAALSSSWDNQLTQQGKSGKLGPEVESQMRTWNIDIVDDCSILRTLPPRRGGVKVWIFDSRKILTM